MNELQRNAIETARRKELESYQRALDIQWLDSRMADGGMSRCLALIQREAEMEKYFQERSDHAAIVNAKAEKEIALGIEVAKVQREETCKLMRRHYLRERDPSLRELQTKLQAAYVCRDLKQQILHNEYRRLQEKAEENRAVTLLRNSLYDDKEEELRTGQAKLESTLKYRAELQQQLVNRQTQKQCQYEDTLIEKKMLDEIMRTISDEDKREIEQNTAIRERLRNEMKMSQLAREAWRQKQRQLLVQEERDIEEQMRAQADRSSGIVAERARRLAEKEAINEKVCAKILGDQAELDRRLDVIRSLQEQEYLEKCVNDDKAVEEKIAFTKKDTKEALTAQMENRKKLEREQRERDVALKNENLKKYNADMEKEREKERKLKEKSRKYSEDLLRQIQNNTIKRQQDKKMEDGRAQYMWDCLSQWDKEVSSERAKIVAEHAPKVLGSIQVDVLKVSDLPHVREGADKDPELKKLDIESMAISNRPKRFSKCNEQCRILRRF